MDWTVVQNNGSTADLEAGPLGTHGRKTIKRSKKMSSKEFFDLLSPGVTVDETTLRAFFEE
jgi:hypothetical protein